MLRFQDDTTMRGWCLAGTYWCDHFHSLLFITAQSYQ